MKNKKNKIGFIAGRGDYPLILCQEAKKNGVDDFVVIGFHEHINENLVKLSDHFQSIYVGQLKKIVKFLKKHQVTQVILSGQIKPSRLYKDLRPDWDMLRLLGSLKEKNAHSIFGAICDYFAKYDIEVLSADTFMDDYLAPQGVFGHIKLTKDRKEDMQFAFETAKKISHLNIGQTCVVKQGTILAVEGFEGTDKTIVRGGQLGFGKVTVAKVAKKDHDMRFDIPCVGLQTINSLIEAKAKTFIVEASKTIFLEKEEVLELCKKHKICLVGA